MDRVLWTAFALLIAHAGACVYLALAKRGAVRKRSVALIVGNLLLLYVFYLPTLVVPQKYVWIFFAGFCAGFFGLMQYVSWLPKRDETHQSK